MKVGLPSLLWSGASILKIVALLSIRFAILFAPMWVPFVVLSGGFLERVMRMIGTAYLWGGVAGATIVALYLVALVKLYYVDNGSVDGSWRLWFMVILSLICWFIMRPFKRISSTFRQNSAGALNRKAVRAKSSIKHKAFDAASFAVGGPATTMAKKTVGAFHRSSDNNDGDDETTLVRPEGRGLIARRQQDSDNARAAARTASDRIPGTSLGRESERDARIAGLAAASGAAALRPKAGISSVGIGTDSDNTADDGTDWPRRRGHDGHSRTEADLHEERSRGLRPAPQRPSVDEEWNGGTSSVIAPMKVFTPTPMSSEHRAPEAATTGGMSGSSDSSRRSARPPTSSVWTPPARPAVDRERSN